jgi:hypothetical protein
MDYATDLVARERLFRAVTASYRALEPFRELNKGLVEEYCGSGYGGKTARFTTLINLMHQLVEAYQMTLVANRPRVMCETMRTDREAFAKQYAIAMNNLIKEIRLEKTFQRWVQDAFFCIGILKIHLADAPLVQLEENIWANPGQPFCSNVSIDNWVHDMTAPNWETIKFCGDMYRLPFSDLQNQPDLFDPDVVSRLTPNSRDVVDSDRLESISRGEEVDDGELEPMITLCDIYIARERKIYTFAVDNRTEMRLKEAPLAVMDWIGNDNGPYPILAFSEVAENTMPISPADQVAELARNANNILRKQFRQAMRQKDILGYEKGQDGTAKKIRNEADGGMVPIAPGTKFDQLKFGGVDPGNQAFLVGVIQMFDRMSGNLTAMLGLGAQTNTKGQEELIHGAVGKKAAQMQYKVVDGAVRVIRDLGKLLWADEAKMIPGRWEIPEAEGYYVDATWTPWDREGNQEDYDLNIDMYSMAYKTPTEKVTGIIQLIKEVYAPLQQLMMQQGGIIDMQKMTEIFSDQLQDPRIAQIFQFNAALPEQQGMQQPGMPQSTERNYIRESVSTGGSPEQRAATEQQQWMAMAAAQAGGQQQ